MTELPNLSESEILAEGLAQIDPIARENRNAGHPDVVPVAGAARGWALGAVLAMGAMVFFISRILARARER